MKLEQRCWTAESGWDRPAGLKDAQLVLLFGGKAALADGRLREVEAAYPQAYLAGCSTAGEIAGTSVRDESLVATAVRCERSSVRGAHIDLMPDEDSMAAGFRLATQLPARDLVHVMVFSDGQHVNGSRLVLGLRQGLPDAVQITGGLAGDGPRFKATLTVAGAHAKEGRITVIGFYGAAIKVGFGSLGGWDSFGPQRRITRSKGNVLFELDGQPALALYKKYLGEHVSGLPATGLLFPLAVHLQGRGEVVRTILGVNEAEQSMTFAGDIPEGSMSRLMKANFDRLIDGAQGAARTSHTALAEGASELAVLISCVGRRLVLKQRVEDEVEAVRDVLGHAAVMTGFYSYGEICPAAPHASCELHNQTMTITTFREA